MIRKLLITGASGFIGQHVVRLLVEEPLGLHLILRPASTIDPGIRNRVEVTGTRDVFQETTDWWGNILDQIDAIVHLAWYVQEGYLTHPKNIDCCVGTLRMIEALKRSQISVADELCEAIYLRYR